MVTIPKTSPHCYISGKYALNVPSPEGTGDWHSSGTIYNTDRAPLMFLCGEGQEYNTIPILGLEGINDKVETISGMGICFEGDQVFVADHFRAIADLVLALSQISTAVRSIILDDFMSTDKEKRWVLDLLGKNYHKIPESYRHKVGQWIIHNVPDPKNPIPG